MARVVYGGGVTEFIGSIGGTTFQSNNSGFIARQLPKLTKRRTLLQTNQVSQFTYYSQLYRGLSSTDKDAWNAFATANLHIDLWGNSHVVDGCRWFIIMNSSLAFLALPLISTPPPYVPPVPSAPFTLSIGNYFLQCDTATTFGLATSFVVVYFTYPLLNGTTLPRKLFVKSGLFIPAYFGTFDNIGAWEAATGLNFTNTILNTGNLIRLGISIIDPTCPIPAPLVFNS